jgi:hypothetical protein
MQDTDRQSDDAMKVQAPFGFVTGCHAGDKVMVQATLASIRYYCPGIPICLVVDGLFDVSDLESEYGLIVLRISELPSVDMRQMIGGNFRAKLAAMWEGPFEFYVWLDSDAIIWGNFMSQIRRDLDFQIFWKEAEQMATPAAPDGFKHFYFDPDLLKKFDANFEWQGRNYFCSGTFACRRNAIPFAEWVKVESWGRQTPGLFAWGEMGMLNYLVHSRAQRGEIKIDSKDLQHVWAHHGKEELVRDCLGQGWHFPKEILRPRVAHFCYRKPFLFDRKSYSRPFTIARLEHYRRHRGEMGAWLAILNEDQKVLLGKVRRRINHYRSPSNS